MKTKLLLLFAIVLSVGARHAVPLQGQELSDTIWSKKINGVHVLKFSPDGQYVFAGVGNDIVQIKSATGEIIRTMSYHKEYVKHIDFSPTGDTIISSGWDGRIVLWNYDTGDTIENISVLKEIDNSAESDAFITPDGKRIITLTGLIGFDKPQILVIDIETKEIIKTFIGRYKNTYCISISLDGNYFSFVDLEGYKTFLILIDLNTYEELTILEDQGDKGIVQVRFSPDSKLIAACADETIFIWDIEKRKLKYSYSLVDPEPSELIANIVFSNDSKYTVFGNRTETNMFNNYTSVWDFENDSIIYKYAYPSNWDGGLDVSADDYIVTCSYGKYIYLLRPNWKVTDVKENFTNELKYSFNNSKLKIYFDDEITAKPEINIYNILGVGARHAVPLHNGVPAQQGNEIEIDLEYLTSGVYFVVVDFAGKRSVLKILKN